MSPTVSLIRELQAAGGRIQLINGRLRVQPRDLPPALVERLRRHKVQLLALLTLPPHDDAGAWQAWRADALAKWSGRGHRADDAERLAFGEAVNLIHSRQPAGLEHGVCAGCRRPVANAAVILLHDGACLHDQTCLVAYGTRWRAAAAAELARLGVPPPPGWEP